MKKTVSLFLVGILVLVLSACSSSSLSKGTVNSEDDSVTTITAEKIYVDDSYNSVDKDTIYIKQYERDLYGNYGKCVILDECDWLTTTERFNWEQFINEEIAHFIRYYEKSAPDTDFERFVSDCLVEGSLTNSLSTEEYKTHMIRFYQRDVFSSIIQKYLMLIEEYPQYALESSSEWYSKLKFTGEIIMKNMGGDYFVDYEEYAAVELAMMDWLVQFWEQDELDTIEENLIRRICREEGFLFYVPAMKIVDGMSGTAIIETDFWFEYDADTEKIISLEGYYEPSWTNDGYKYYCQFDASRIPEWALDEDLRDSFEKKYKTYLTENEWDY